MPLAVEIEELAPDGLEPVDAPHELLAPPVSGISDTVVGVFAARAGTPAATVAPPTAPCETSRRAGMPDRTREMLAEQTPEMTAAGMDVLEGSYYYVFGRSCRAASRGVIDRTLYGRVRRQGPVYSTISADTGDVRFDRRK